MARASVLILTAAIAACAATKATTAGPSSGAADEPFAIWPPLMPSAIDLDTVPLGRWAEYDEAYLGSVTIKERVALVGRGADGATIETTTVMPSGETTVFANLFAPRNGGGVEVTSSVFQVSGADPMESPPLPPSQQPYPRVDPSKLVGIDTIKVRAGTYRAKHYRDRTAYGEQVDVWIDESVGPIGLIRMEAEQKQHPTIRAGFTFELVAAGSDAIQQITKAPLPFDASLLRKRGLPWTRQARVGPQPPAKEVR